MCFSAEASFIVGAALLPAGAYCIRASAAKDSSYLAFAVVPILFGIQQIGEGAVWLGLRRGDPDLIKSASLFFLSFAFVVWPFWISFSSWMAETQGFMKRWLGVFALIGLVFGLLLFIPIFYHSGNWLTVSKSAHSIRYDFEILPVFNFMSRLIWLCVYVSLILAPLFLVGQRELRVFGLLVGASAVVSCVAYWSVFVSVWCMFSAVLTIYLVYFFSRLQETFRPVVV